MTGCPACGGPLEVVHELRGVPVGSCLLVEDAAHARAFPTGDLVLAVCLRCAFVTNTAFDPGVTTYDPSYEETQGFSPRFQAFARELAARWVAEYGLTGAHVVELGAGKGEFAALLAEEGGCDVLAVDPGIHPERVPVPRRGQVTAVRDVFRPEHLGRGVDAVVCRHTLEHISDVTSFLQQVRRGVADGVPVLFELPDTSRVLREAAFEDVYWEHCSYFTAGSLSRLFRRCGFDVLGCELAYDGQYLLIAGRPGLPNTELTAHDQADVVATVQAARHFRDAFSAATAHWTAVLSEVKDAGGRNVLWGGGSKAVAFLTTLGVPGDVDAVVDINPHKQGKALPGTGHIVVSPESLVEMRPDLVVVMNPVYVEEVRDMLRASGLTPRITALSPTGRGIS